MFENPTTNDTFFGFFGVAVNGRDMVVPCTQLF